MFRERGDDKKDWDEAELRDDLFYLEEQIGQQLTNDTSIRK